MMTLIATDSQLQLMALQEISLICTDCLRYLTPGSGLSHALAQIQLRALYLERHHPMSARDQQSFRDSEETLLRYLSPNPGLSQ
jgi:hypothetical protein